MLRMGKDFGDNVLPVDHGFASTSNEPPLAHFTWFDVFPMMEFSLKEITQHGDLPGWCYGFHQAHAAVILYLPTSSGMSRRWARMGSQANLMDNLALAAKLSALFANATGQLDGDTTTA